MPQPTTYITYHELFDGTPTREELHDIVRGLNAFGNFKVWVTVASLPLGSTLVLAQPKLV